MRKAVLISIKPEWCALIAAGEKTVEVRKNKPKISSPFKCYIYCSDKNTSDPHKLLETHSNGKSHRCNGKVWAEFVCDYIERFAVDYRMNCTQTERISQRSCVDFGKLINYGLNSSCLYAWRISDFVLYDTPKELNEFRKACGTQDCDICKFWENTGEYAGCLTSEVRRLYRPPQSWCYVEDLERR